MIVKKDTGQKYIGQSNNIEKRFKQHCTPRRTHISNAIQKYGKENFIFSIICELERDDDLLNAMEEYYIWKYNTYEDKNHYNLTPGGDFNPMRNKSIVQKVRISNQKYWDNGGREEQSIRFSGKNNPFYGKHHSKETITKIKENQTLLYEEDNPNFKESNNTIYREIRKGINNATKQGFSFYYIEDAHRVKKCQKFSDLIEWCIKNNKKLTRR